MVTARWTTQEMEVAGLDLTRVMSDGIELELANLYGVITGQALWLEQP